MKITLHIDTTLSLDAFLRAAATGLVSTTDAGEAVIAALEAAQDTAPAKRSREQVAAVLAAAGGNVSAAARALGIARSTVRAAVHGTPAKVPTCPACEVRPGVLDGYCAECDRDLRAEYDARRAGDEWMPR